MIFKRRFSFRDYGYDGSTEVEARSQIGGRGATTAGTATTENLRRGAVRQPYKYFPETSVAGELFLEDGTPAVSPRAITADNPNIDR